MSAAQYRILSPAGAGREDGSADVEVTGGALVLAPSGSAVLRVPFGQIASVTEPQPFTVLVTLADGNAIELSRLGVMRTQLLAELRDGRGDDAATAAAAVGQPTVFTATSGGEQVEVRVYDDALLLAGAAGSERVGFSFVGQVGVRDYVVTIEVAGRPPVALSRLGRRTEELAGLLGDRLREARGRTSAFLASLLPGLDPMALREAAGLLRDGVAVPVSRLDAVHPDLSGTLLQVAVLPERRDAAAELGRLTDLAIGFRQVVSVRQAATGVTPWHDHAASPHIGEHDSPGGWYQPGMMGMMAAGVMSGGPMAGPGGLGQGGFGPSGFGPAGAFTRPGGAFGYGQGYDMYGDYWAFRALGAGLNTSPGQRPMAARADVTRGRLTPATEDLSALSALSAAGSEPTVLAFALGSHAGHVAYEVLNQAEPTTFVYQADGAAGLAALNRALDDVGFQAAAVHASGLTAPARPAAPPELLTAALTGQVPHDGHWQERLAELLGG
jgi:hypothetical protein